MQVIASKDAAIEDLKKQLQKQLATETDNFKKIKVCGKGVKGESLCTVTDPNTQANGFTCYIHAYISGGPGEGREGPGGGRKGEDSVWSRACAMVGVRGS